MTYLNLEAFALELQTSASILVLFPEEGFVFAFCMLEILGSHFSTKDASSGRVFAQICNITRRMKSHISWTNHKDSTHSTACFTINMQGRAYRISILLGRNERPCGMWKHACICLSSSTWCSTCYTSTPPDELTCSDEFTPTNTFFILALMKHCSAFEVVQMHATNILSRVKICTMSGDRTEKCLRAENQGSLTLRCLDLRISYVG